MRNLTLALLGLLATWSHADEPLKEYAALYEALMKRSHIDSGKIYGKDGLEPLLMAGSRYLLEGDSNSRISKALDALLACSEEKVREQLTPIQRALLQRHLWAAFDWMEQNERSRTEEYKALQAKLAQCIRRLALNRQSIDELLDTYRATTQQAKDLDTMFPTKLYDEDSPWVCLGPNRHGVAAIIHGDDISWRSAFTVFVRSPDGAEATRQYLKQLNKFPKPYICDKPSNPKLQFPAMSPIGLYFNPDTPQFPEGTQFALVRRALLIDDNGELASTPWIEKIQVREHRSVDPLNHHYPFIKVAEFRMKPTKMLLEEDHALYALGINEGEYRLFMNRGRPDPLEDADVNMALEGLRTCAQCHSQPGIHAVASRNQMFRLSPSLLPPQLHEGKPNESHQLAIDRKEAHRTWDALREMWKR